MTFGTRAARVEDDAVTRRHVQHPAGGSVPMPLVAEERCEQVIEPPEVRDLRGHRGGSLALKADVPQRFQGLAPVGDHPDPELVEAAYHRAVPVVVGRLLGQGRRRESAVGKVKFVASAVGERGRGGHGFDGPIERVIILCRQFLEQLFAAEYCRHQGVQDSDVVDRFVLVGHSLDVFEHIWLDIGCFRGR